MDSMFVGIMATFFDKYDSEEKYKKRASEVVSIINLYNSHAKKVLELACGTGNFTKHLVNAGFVVTATDISQDEIILAKQKKIDAKFSVADMSELSAKKEYDVVGCFWESFRYLPNFKICQDTLKRIFKGLKHDGLFLVDFACFPPTPNPIKLAPKTIDVGEGLFVTQQVTLQTKGNYEIRYDDISYMKNGKDITGTTIIWNEKRTLLKPTMKRAPQLRISKEKMAGMLEKVGFKVVDVRSGFNGYPESTLFVAQKQ